MTASFTRTIRQAGLALTELSECVIDEAWLATKPKWRQYLNWPVSFAAVWTKRGG